MPISRTPTILPTGVQHARPWRDGARSVKVPLWHDNPLGEWLEGFFDLPARLAHAAPDTNERHEFDRRVRDFLARWVEWRGARGWEIASTPKVRGPYDLPHSTVAPAQKVAGLAPKEADEALRRYFVIARFKRRTPVYVGLDDFLATRDEAQRFNVAPAADPLPWVDLSGKEDSGWVDPMEYAEQRRQRLGLKREDYLLGPLDEPL